jgi:hypothetical protein
MIIYWILGGVAALFVMKSQSGAAAAQTKNKVINGTNAQSGKNPASAQGKRVDNSQKGTAGSGQTNQPWYQGAAVAGAGLAITAIGSELKSLWESSPDDNMDAPTDADFEEATDSLSDNFDCGDDSDVMGDTEVDFSSEA